MPGAAPRSRLVKLLISRSVRITLLVVAHVILLAAALTAALWLRFDFALPEKYAPSLAMSLCAVLALKVAVFHGFRLYQGWWRYVSVTDLVRIVAATVTAAATLWVIVALWPEGPVHLPRTVLLIDAVLTVSFVGGTRALIRLGREWTTRAPAGEPKRVLVVGSGDLAESLVREVGRTPGYRVVGVVDDDPRNQGFRIRGVPIFGTLEVLSEILATQRATKVYVAQPELAPPRLRMLVDACRAANATLKIVPTAAQRSGNVVAHLQDVDTSRLLGREAVSLGDDLRNELIAGATVLVTGAGGSIGSELVRQLARLGPRHIILVDRYENGVFHVDRELRARFPEVGATVEIADVCNAARMQALLARWRPAAVYHAAAHKHVPLMECNPAEAVANNLGGTRTVFEAAIAARARVVMLVSTDKAVNPESVMGASKRLAELYVLGRSASAGDTRLGIVRFGNVLGSNGSVVEVFKRQIAAGTPVTVTDPDMERYFMTIAEAAQLVVQASALAEGGEIFILEMGKPVRILRLAEDLIRLAGHRPGVDVPIVFSGRRPGEKLTEELSYAFEKLDRTLDPRILLVSKSEAPPAAVLAGLDALLAAAPGLGPAELRYRVRLLVPQYKPDDRSPAELSLAS